MLSLSIYRLRAIKLSKVILFAVFLFGLSFPSLTASAYDFKAESGLSTTGKEAGYKEQNTPDPTVIAGQVVQAVLSVLAIVFLAFMIYAGITWLTAQGDDQKAMKAKKIIEESITGLVIVIAAYAISYFIIGYFATTGTIKN